MGGNQSTFLSIIRIPILAFTDESVINTDGDGLYTESGGGGNEVAEISVSNDLENYEFLGYAYPLIRENGFDLDNINLIGSGSRSKNIGYRSR